MKTRQLQSTPTTTAMASFRSKQWVPPSAGITCERELRHELAAREREEQMKRDRAKAAAAAAAQRVRQHRMISAERNQPANRGRTTAGAALKNRLGAGISNVYGVSARAAKAVPPESQPKAEQAATTQAVAVNPQQSSPPKTDPGVGDEKAERLRVQLEELTQLPEQQFEQGFRKWLDQEGIARDMHCHLRAELINCFNNTALGQLLNKAAGLQMAQSHALLTSPLAMALPTLVAEFLHSQNCHFTLSVFCSEMPHRHTLPKFEKRPDFRFRTDELQQVLGAVLGGGDPEQLQPDEEFNSLVEGHYEEDLAGQTQSLLMALMRSLVEIRRWAISREEQQQLEKEKLKEMEKLREMEKLEEMERENQKESKKLPVDCASQTEPSACLEARPEVDTSRLYQTEEQELILGADGRSVFVGPRVSQSLHAVEQQMADLMKNLRRLTKSCAPPVEVISEESFEQLIQREIRERDRLTKAGQTFNPGVPVIKLPKKSPKKKAKPLSKEDEVVNSELGPIILPAGEVELPPMLPLHPEQFSSLAVIRQSLDNAQKKTRLPQARMYVSVQRMETLMSDVCGCVQLLTNVLNLSMEQEHAVGQQKGFKEGYLEGFGHGHFMGVQEGRLREQNDRSKNKKEATSQVQVSTKIKATQTTRRRLPAKNHIHSQTDAKSVGNASTQVNTKTPSKSYDQWIQEMLHSANGQKFLERVEISLYKALKLQKQRLDELFLVKLRHQAELLRLCRRQSSWRSLCRRIERDSHLSAETQDIVQKIFGLLEHYETHHHLLLEKIQQTELAAEQETYILPMLTGQEGTSASAAPPSSSAHASCEVSKPVKLPVTPSNSSRVPHLYPGLAYPYQLLTVSSPSGLPVSTAYIPVDPLLASHYRYYKSSESYDPADKESHCQVSGRQKTHSGVSMLPSCDVDSAKDPKDAATPVTIKHPDGDDANAVPPSVSVTKDDPESPKISAAEGAASVATPASESSQPLEPTPPVKTPLKPSVHDVATNTIAQPPPPQPILSTAQPTQGPSFEEALLSAKNRLQQLEEESDLLEQSFLSYLEQSKANTPQKSNKEPLKPRRMPPSTSQLREQHEKLDRTLDSFMMDRQRKILKEDAALREAEVQDQPPKLDSKLSSPLWLSELEEGHDQDKYQFTNAISEARKKLLNEISLEQKVAEIEHLEQAEQVKRLEKLQPSTDWLPGEMPKVLSIVKPTELLSDITPTKSSSSNGEMKLLLRRAKDALGLRSPNPLLDSSSDSSSMEDPSLRVNRSPSQKLQQSMAKMELLFGGPLVSSKPKKSSKPTKAAARPVSAPTTGAENVRLEPPRPHTAPTLYPIQESQQQSPAGIQLDISTSTTISSSTSPSSLPRRRSLGGSFEELVASAVMGPDTTPEVSYSQDFWKRMNL